MPWYSRGAGHPGVLPDSIRLPTYPFPRSPGPCRYAPARPEPWPLPAVGRAPASLKFCFTSTDTTRQYPAAVYRCRGDSSEPRLLRALAVLWESVMRLSVLQRRILRWLYVDHLRTPKAPGSAYRALLTHLPHAPGSIARSLRRLARDDLVTLLHSPGGRLQWVRLTATGHHLVWQLGRDGLQDADGGG